MTTFVRAGDPYDVGAIGFDCPPLPFDPAALEPIISRESVLAHYGQHQNYCRQAKRLAEEADPSLLDLPLIEVVRRTAFRDPGVELNRVAGQAWNHAFLWLSLRPVAKPSKFEELPYEHYLGTALGSRAERSKIDGFRRLQDAIASVACDSFGSQWAWLVYVGDQLEVMLTDDADSPITKAGVMPLLVIDLWEHAFFLDYRFARAKYVRAVVEKALNWDRADVLLTLELC